MKRLRRAAGHYQKAIGAGTVAALVKTYDVLPSGLAKTILSILIAGLGAAGVAGALPYRPAKKGPRR